MPAFEQVRHTFEHAWNDIILASWKKYPCSERKDVVQLDLMDRSFDPETGILKTTRVCQAKSNTPGWFNLIFGTPKWVYFVEQATIDPRNNTMKMESRNITFGRLLEMRETCIYTPHPKRADWTDLDQQATCKSFTWGAAPRIEEFCVGRFKANAERGQRVMEMAMGRIRQEAQEGLVTIEEMRQRIRDDAGRYVTVVETAAADALAKAYVKPRPANAEEPRAAVEGSAETPKRRGD